MFAKYSDGFQTILVGEIIFNDLPKCPELIIVLEADSIFIFMFLCGEDHRGRRRGNYNGI